MLNTKAIKQRMKDMGVTQADAAKALGVKAPTVSQKINGVRPMSLTEARILAELLGIKSDEFGAYFFGDAERTEPTPERREKPYRAIKVRESLPKLEKYLAYDTDKLKEMICEKCRGGWHCADCFLKWELDELLKLSNAVAVRKVLAAASAEAGRVLEGSDPSGAARHLP